MHWFRRRKNTLEEAFLKRYRGRTVIVHDGFPAGWLEELLQQPGGGGHFRVDIRALPNNAPTPVERFVQRHIIPHSLPLPLLFQVGGERIYLRHLTRKGKPVHPGEIGSMLIELPRRHHYALQPAPPFPYEPGLPVDDNDIDYDHLFSDD